ncbi:catalase [Paenibacillus campi]|uniref:catalase n=1 Tax=Paenibacillus campi TaxID=3106031 RepID=UPI002AFED383|nr:MULTISPECIES: catalase [unclassified Paenibacillus]
MADENKKQPQSNDQEENVTLTNRQGHPVTDNQNVRTVGNRGPITMENYNFLEKITHFDRERVPERVVHARGAGAHGVFEAYGTVGDEPVSKYTRAKLFQEKGKQTPVFVRFSTVVHGGHSPETLRDPRGFATKFYTEDGNWDLVGNNLKIFFIRDPLKFPDMVHAFKPDPITNVQDMERFFDFIGNSPESTHMITFLFSPWGIPANYREMQGSGVNTYKWVNEAGEAVLIKYHWEPLQGIRNLLQDEANQIQALDFNHATIDLYDAIQNGDYPEWELCVQIMEDSYHPELDFDPLDPTKLWPEDKFPFLKVGKMTLNRNPEDYFNEVEQVAFGTGVLVDGLDFSDDKLLQGRTFSYSDTQRHRVGSNYQQLPINAPHSRVATNHSGGQMRYHSDRAPGQNPHVNYEPSSLGGLKEAPKPGKDHEPEYYDARLMREKIDRPNDFVQAGETYRNFEDWERDELVKNLGGNLAQCNEDIRGLVLANIQQADEEYGRRVQEEIDKALADPTMGKPTHRAHAAAKKAEHTGHDAKPY